MLALTGWATVPSGFMRVSGPEGMRLVLCTADGPQEIFVDANGTPIPGNAREDEPDEDMQKAPCVLSGVVPLLVPVTAIAPGGADRTRLIPWRATHQVAARGPPRRVVLARAPPRPV